MRIVGPAELIRTEDLEKDGVRGILGSTPREDDWAGLATWVGGLSGSGSIADSRRRIGWIRHDGRCGKKSPVPLDKNNDQLLLTDLLPAFDILPLMFLSL